jgi:hypothetical protein
VDAKTKEVMIKKLSGTYYRIVAPYNDRAQSTNYQENTTI